MVPFGARYGLAFGEGFGIGQGEELEHVVDKQDDLAADLNEARVTSGYVLFEGAESEGVALVHREAGSREQLCGLLSQDRGNSYLWVGGIACYLALHDGLQEAEGGFLVSDRQGADTNLAVLDVVGDC